MQTCLNIMRVRRGESQKMVAGGTIPTVWSARRTPALTKRNAFTLIELLVVIAIIALLISILLPALQNARDVAKTVQCNAKMRNIGLASVMYLADHNQRYAPILHWPDGGSGPSQWWYDHFATYWNSEDPANPGYFAHRGSFDRQLIIRCPIETENSPRPSNGHLNFESDFLYNAALAPRYRKNGSILYDDVAGTPERVRDLSRTLLFIDGKRVYEDTIRNAGKTDIYAQNSKVDYRHNGFENANILFGDGHAETQKMNLSGNRYLDVAWSDRDGDNVLWKE